MKNRYFYFCFCFYICFGYILNPFVCNQKLFNANIIYSLPNQLESATSGQYIDHIYTFNSTNNMYSFPLYMNKYVKYSFYVEIMSACSKMDLDITVIGDDWDGVNGLDRFIIVRGNFGDSDGYLKSESAYFCPSRTGNYVIQITGRIENPSLNVNTYIKFSEQGTIYNSGVLYELDPYHDLMTRKYYVNLKDDVSYGIRIARTHTWQIDETYSHRSAYITLVIKSFDGLEFNLIDNKNLEVAFESANTFAKFALSKPGTYEISVFVNLGSDVPVCNIAVYLYENGNVGDGPEEVPTEAKNSFDISLLIDSGMIYILILVFGIVLTIYTLQKKHNGSNDLIQR